MSNPLPALSFAIPYYNNRRYLTEAIDSIRAQIFTDWELIVVDDAGPEPADDLVVALGDPRITYVRNATNLGLAANWNECIRLSRGPLVSLLHGDDRYHPDYAARVITAAADFPEVPAIFTDNLVIGDDGQPTRSLPDFVKRFARRAKGDHHLAGDRHLASILANHYIICPTYCYRKAAVGDAPFDPRWKFVPDLDFTSRQLLAGNSLHVIRSPLLDYRRHGGSQTTGLSEHTVRFQEEIDFYEVMRARSAAIGWSISERAARHRTMIRTHMVLEITLNTLRGRFGAANAKRRLLWRDLRHGHRNG